MRRSWLAVITLLACVGCALNVHRHSVAQPAQRPDAWKRLLFTGSPTGLIPHVETRVETMRLGVVHAEASITVRQKPFSGRFGVVNVRTKRVLFPAVAFGKGQTIVKLPNPFSGTATITPNDSTLVRFVVCSDNNVPYEIDNATPYTCGTPPTPHAIYYVRPDGNNSNTGTSNTAGGAWRDIDAAADKVALTSGDIVRVQAGTYVENVTPSRSGTSGAGNTITFVADGTVNTCRWSFSGQNYIRVIGFVMNPAGGGCSSGSPVNISSTNTGLEFWDNDLGNYAGKGFNADSSNRCNSCIIIGGSIHDISTGDTALVLSGNDDFVGYVSLTTIDYLGVGPAGNRQRFVNLNVSGMLGQAAGRHPDFFYIQGLNTLGWSDALVEAMFGIGTPASDDNKFMHAQNQQSNAWLDVVWRFNVGHDLGSANPFSMYTDSGAGAITRWWFYNNSHIYGDRAHSGGAYDNCGSMRGDGGAITFYVFMSIFYQCWADDAVSGLSPWSIVSGATASGANYNLAYTPLGSPSFASAWTSQLNEQTNQNPNLANVSGDDFTIASASGGAYHNGGPLTTATGCSGTSLTLATNTGSAFKGDNSSNLPQYGGALVPGDPIFVNGQARRVQSRSSDTLTLDQSTTCSNGDAVYYGDSSTVDIGAYPQKSGGFALSASKSGNPTGTSSFTARVYPRYASQTSYVVAN